MKLYPDNAPKIENNTDPLAPVIIFAYKRLDHLQRMIDSLLRNAEAFRTQVRIYCDGARTAQDQVAVESVRRYVEAIRGFASVEPVFRTQNLGLAKSIISGVTETLRSYEQVIVLEDDLILSPYFLRYMNDALCLYSSDDVVASIHGYCYPTAGSLPDTFFIRGADCWGWATWRRAWRHFDADGTSLLAKLKERRLTRCFDMDGTFPFTEMLIDEVAGRNDSWAIRWHAGCFLAERLTLYPGRSLVHNDGFDSTGQHCNTTSDFAQSVSNKRIPVRRQELVESEAGRSAFVAFFRSIQAPWPQRYCQRAFRTLSRAYAGATKLRIQV